MVDRCTVAGDLYESEAWFMEKKRDLIMALLFAYENTTDMSQHVRGGGAVNLFSILSTVDFVLYCVINIFFIHPPPSQADLAQRITNVIAQRPRLDLDAAYFTESYAAEIVVLDLSVALFREMASHIVEVGLEVFVGVRAFLVMNFPILLPHPLVRQQTRLGLVRFDDE